MIKKIVALVAVLVVGGGIYTPEAKAISLSINLGDQPYYSHGSGYWRDGAYYIWIPGHWTWRGHHKVWIHGHYRVR